MSPRDLRSRLAQFDKSGRTKESGGAVRRASDDERVRRRQRHIQGLLDHGARRVGSGSEAHLRFERQLDRSSWPGTPSSVVPDEAWTRMGVAPPPRGRRWLVLDTETTGLESGTGTLVFMVGLVRWTPRGARLIQLVLPEPAAEKSMLEALWTELDDADALISYNGRSFDLARLRSRAVLSRLGLESLRKPHLDLIHPLRRVASRWLPDCRLATVEEQLLDRGRVDDLPSAEVPGIYRSFLTGDEPEEGLGGDAVGLVLEHNRLDVENLLELSRWLSSTYLDGPDPARLPASAELALGRALLDRGFVASARARLASAGTVGQGTTAREALWHLARSHKREGDAGEAHRLFREACRRWPSWLESRVELAKLQEHQLGDFGGALRTVQRAMSLLDQLEVIGREGEEAVVRRAELQHRLSRITRRAGRGVA